jgi:hypothetical protein
MQATPMNYDQLFSFVVFSEHLSFTHLSYSPPVVDR